MDNAGDPKRYNILENILQNVNRKYIALPADETKRNNKLLAVIDIIIQKMRSKSTLFDNLYQNKYYGGSFYDNLKISEPSEYDLDCLLSLPKIVEPTVEVSDKPGYVHVWLREMKILEKRPEEASKYSGLEKLLDGNNRLCTKKVRSWMESLMATVLAGTSNIKVKIGDNEYTVKATFSKSGPAVTIKLQGDFDQNEFNIDVDLVPCFTFFEDQWPKTGYRQNPSKIRDTFFVVPKSPNETDLNYWRLSFQAQERDLINDYAVMKPTIRLIKKIRDRYQHKIASYFIKSVFLWELEKMDKTFWKNTLSFVFITMLRRYSEYVLNRSIPYYWNEGYNLIGDLPEITASCIGNKLKNMVDEIDRTLLTFPYGVVYYFLRQAEVDMETFKKETPLGKKQLRLLVGTVKKPASQDDLVTIDPQLDSSQSSDASSFEEITKERVKEHSKSPISVLELTDSQLSSSQSSDTSGFEEITKHRVNEHAKSPTSVLEPATFTTDPQLSSSQSSDASNLEDITKHRVDEHAKSPVSVLAVINRLEVMCLSIHSDQKRILNMLETALDKIEKCEMEINQLREGMSKRNELPKDESLELFLSGNEILKTTTNFKTL